MVSHIFFMFTPIPREMIQFDVCIFFKGVVQPTTSNSLFYLFAILGNFVFETSETNRGKLPWSLQPKQLQVFHRTSAMRWFACDLARICGLHGRMDGLHLGLYQVIMTLVLKLAGGFKCFLFSSLFGETIQFDYIIFFRWVETTN